jgi:nucleoid DNA-binding protein
MSKAIIVTDFAYKGPKRKGRGTGHQGLRGTLKYLQYRDDRNKHVPQDKNAERWVDRGLGQHYRAIFENCDHLQSKHVLAWTWVVSPSPDLMTLVPEAQRRDLLHNLTELVVEDYYTQRGFDVPEYSYVVHDSLTQPDEQGEVLQHLHAHVVLPGTAPLPGADRAAVYNFSLKSSRRPYPHQNQLWNRRHRSSWQKWQQKRKRRQGQGEAGLVGSDACPTRNPVGSQRGVLITLTKKKMISEIGRRTRLKNRDVQAMLETLVQVWTEELVSGGRIELENLCVLETQTINRGENTGSLRGTVAPRRIRRVTIRLSKKIKGKLNEQKDID